MDCNWLLVNTIRINIFDVKLFGQIKIYLNRGALPGPAQDIADFYINLRTIKNTFTRINLE